MTTVLVFKGSSQYDALRLFSDEIANGFRLKGCAVTVVDMLTMKNFADVLNKQYDIIFKFNGIGDNDPAFVDLLNGTSSTVINFYVDHPVCHAVRINANVNNCISLFVCNSHTKSPIIKNNSERHFLPHGGIFDQAAKLTLDSFTNKSNDLVFIGTYYGIEAKAEYIYHADKTINNICHQTSALMEDGRTLESAINTMAKKYRMTDARKLDFYKFLYTAVYNRRRSLVRCQVLRTLLNAGLNIKAYGNGDWDSLKQEYKNLYCNGPISMAESLRVIQSHKFIINDCSFFPNGSHERVFNTLLQGSLPISYESSYFKGIFPDNSAVYFNSKILNQLPKKIIDLKNNPKTAFSMMMAGYEIAKQHTWQNRVQSILEIWEKHKQTRYVQI